MMTDEAEKLTEDQEHDICYIIGDWYLIWKRSLFNKEAGGDYIDCAVYMLKNMIKNASSTYANIKWELTDKQLEEISLTIYLWSKIFRPTCAISTDGRIRHNFGHMKECLKSMICKSAESDDEI